MNKAHHSVKSWSMFFEDILSGERTSDIRKEDDRRYNVGDYMFLREFDPVKFEYTGRSLQVEITYVQRNKSNPCAISREALKDGYCVLSIKKVGDLVLSAPTPAKTADQLKVENLGGGKVYSGLLPGQQMWPIDSPFWKEPPKVTRGVAAGVMPMFGNDDYPF